MATIDDIRASVLNDVRADSAEQREQEQARIQAAEEKKRTAIVERAEKQRQTFAREEQNRVKTSLEALTKQKRWEELQFERRELDAIFDAAIERLNEQSSEALFDAIEQALALVPERPTTVKLGAENAHTLTAEQRQALTDAHPELSVAEGTLVHAGGFLLSQHSIDYNFTYQALLADLASDLSAQVLAKAEQGAARDE